MHMFRSLLVVVVEVVCYTKDLDFKTDHVNHGSRVTTYRSWLKPVEAAAELPEDLFGLAFGGVTGQDVQSQVSGRDRSGRGFTAGA